jgi:transposase
VGVPQLPNLDHLSHAEKDALIRALWAQVQSLTARVAALEAKLNEPAKTPDNSGLPPSKGQKPNQPGKAKRIGPRRRSHILKNSRIDRSDALLRQAEGL